MGVGGYNFQLAHLIHPARKKPLNKYNGLDVHEVNDVVRRAVDAKPKDSLKLRFYKQMFPFLPPLA